MTIKPGAKIRGIRPELAIALQIIDGIYRAHGLELMITEGTGATHMAGSLHYVGQAADLRSSNVPTAIHDPVINEIRTALGAEFDFVVEADHFHVEFQPKTP